MKTILTTLLTLAIIYSCSNSKDSTDSSSENKTNIGEKSIEIASIDTLVITNSALFQDAFSMGADPLSQLTSMNAAKIETETFLNRHVDNQIDTTFKIQVGEDYFEVYKNPSENFITAAHLKSNAIPLNNGLSVGSTKEEFKKLMNVNELSFIPDHIRVQTEEILEWMDVRFKADTIVELKFNGYLD